jgi:polar amino acid transport system substrate-binding protein
MKEAIKKVNRIYPINISSYDFLPWKRALNRAKRVPNVLFYSLSRSLERESQYQWLGEVSVYRKALFKLKKRPFSVEAIEDIKTKGLVLAVQNGGSDHSHFNSLGFKGNKNFRTYNNYQQGIKQLFKSRVDLIPLNILTAKRSACKLGLDGNQLEMVLTIDALSKPLWAVLSNGTDPLLVAEFQTAIENIHDTGLAKRYYQESMKLWERAPCKQYDLIEE